MFLFDIAATLREADNPMLFDIPQFTNHLNYDGHSFTVLFLPPAAASSQPGLLMIVQILSLTEVRGLAWMVYMISLFILVIYSSV